MLYVISLFFREANVDDAWIGEQVYWLNKDGQVKNVLMKNYYHNESGLKIYHKGFVFAGLLMVKSFGFSLMSLKSLSLAMLIIFLAVFYYYLVIYKHYVKPKYFLFILFLILLEGHIYEYSFVFRPELMLMLFGFISFMFMEFYLNGSKYKNIFAFISILFASASLLIHLNGIIIIIATSVLLIRNKKIKPLIVLALGSLIALAFNFWHLESLNDFTLWLQHMLNYQSNNTSTDYYSKIISLLMNPVNEQMRYLHSPKEVILSLILLVSVFAEYSLGKNKDKNLLAFLFSLIISLTIISPSKSAKYLIPLIPFISILFIKNIILYWRVKEDKVIIPHKFISSSLSVILILFVCISIIYDVSFSFKKNETEKYSQISEDIIGNSSAKSSILAPMTFIFEEMDNYKEIVGLMSYNERAKTEEGFYSYDFFKRAEKEGFNYIILNENYINKFGLKNLLAKNNSGNYTTIGSLDGLVVLEHQNGIAHNILNLSQSGPTLNFDRKEINSSAFRRTFIESSTPFSASASILPFASTNIELPE